MVHKKLLEAGDMNILGKQHVSICIYLYVYLSIHRAIIDFLISLAALKSTYQYNRNLSGEIGQEFTQRQQDDKPVDDLIRLVDDIIPFDMSHNAGKVPFLSILDSFSFGITFIRILITKTFFQLLLLYRARGLRFVDGSRTTREDCPSHR